MRISYLLVVAVAGCAVGAPAGFSSGNQWTLPLVDPLDDGVLVTPVKINGRGPYLFAIDPDAQGMIVDERVVVEAQMRVNKAGGPKLLDETDTSQIRFFAEVLQLQVGTLTVEQKTALVVKHGTYYVPGRAIDGVLGRSVIADSLAFGFDRDRGLAFLTTQGAFVRPPGATELHYDVLDARLNADLLEKRDPSGAAVGTVNSVRPVGRRLAKATIGGATLTMHLDLGGVVSQLRDRAWARAGVQPIDRSLTLLDETGTAHVVSKLAVAPRVTAGGANADQVLVAPYVEKRWDDELFDGALGLNFFRAYDVWANWDQTTLYLTPRSDPAAAMPTRLARWGAPFASCPHPGCVTARVIDPLAGKTLEPGAAHPGVVLSIVRDPNVAGDLEVTLVATNRPDRPRVVVNLPAGADRVMEHLHDDWSGAELQVIDVSPFPRSCPMGGGCVELVGS